MVDINVLKFDDKGLIPAIVVDSITKKVLTLAYMNEEMAIEGMNQSEISLVSKRISEQGDKTYE